MTRRLAYLCGEYPRATDTFIQREVAALRQRGFEVHTLSVRRPVAREAGGDEQAEARAATVYLLPCPPWRLLAEHARLFARSPRRYVRTLGLALTLRAPGARALLWQLFYFAEAGLAAAHLARHGIGHVHNHAPDASGTVTLLASHLVGGSYSLTLHGYGILAEPQRWRLADKLARARFAVCVSQHALGQAMLHAGREHWARLHVVHCGVDVGAVAPRAHAGRGTRLLFAGRLDVVKGVPLLLQAMAALRERHGDARLVVAGDGPQAGQLRALAAGLGVADRVDFLGYVPQAELRRRLAETDVVVMASFFEGIPVGLMEALAAGVPVVAPHITGIPELVDDGVSGYLVPSGDVATLADRVSRLLDDAALRQRFGEAGRAKVARGFELGAQADALAALFERRLADEDPR